MNHAMISAIAAGSPSVSITAMVRPLAHVISLRSHACIPQKSERLVCVLTKSFMFTVGYSYTTLDVQAPVGYYRARE